MHKGTALNEKSYTGNLWMISQDAENKEPYKKKPAFSGVKMTLKKTCLKTKCLHQLFKSNFSRNLYYVIALLHVYNSIMN